MPSTCTLTEFAVLFVAIHTQIPLLFLPYFHSPDPRAEYAAAAIKNDQVRICAWVERALPILNAETPRGIVCRAFNCLTQRTPREA